MFTSHGKLGYSLKVMLGWFPNTAAVSADVIRTINSSSGWRRLTHFLCEKNRAKVMLLSEVCLLYHAEMMWPDLLDEWHNVPQFPYPAAVVSTRNCHWVSFFCRTQKKIFWEMPQCCFVQIKSDLQNICWTQKVWQVWRDFSKRWQTFSFPSIRCLDMRMNVCRNTL